MVLSWAQAMSLDVIATLHRPTTLFPFLGSIFPLIISSGFNEDTEGRIQISGVCFFCFEFTSHLSILVGLAIFVLSSYGMVAPVQGGVGAWHFMVIAALMLYLPHMPDIENMAKVFALLTHGSMTLLYVVVGIICVVMFPLYNRDFFENK